jgi:hypothetical protein|tara:strand:+ start:455 stop:733 length:279 start_codon:yes stop_codon:yes gene_type:complete
MTKSKKQKLKEAQANMQSDNLELDNWMPGDGLTMSGSFNSMDNDFDISYDQLDLGFDEEDLRKKYPALKDAHNHYKNVLDMCRTREKELDEN